MFDQQKFKEENMTEQTSLNNQIIDSIEFLKKVISGTEEENVMAIAYQIMAHAAGMAMLNAVNQQQQMYILQNAVTTATAKSALEKSPEEAIKIINASLNNSTMIETIKELKIFMDDLTKSYNDIKTKSGGAKTRKNKTRNKKVSKPKPDSNSKNN